MVSPGSTLSFQHLDRLISQAARHLHQHGVRTDDRVALSCNGELAVLVLILATARIGATAFSLPLSTPSVRRAALAQRAGASLVVTDHSESEPAGLPQLHIDLATLAADDTPVSTAVYVESPSAPWLIIAGSGSTGHPRLIAVTHEQFISRLELTRDSLSLSPEDRLLSLAPLAFTSPKERCLATLAVGGSIVFGNRINFAPTVLCRKYGVTVLDANVYHLEQLLAALPGNSRNVLGGLRVLLVSASTVSDGLRQRIASVLSPALYVRYGTNETGLLSIAPPQDALTTPGTVGRPLADISIKVVDGTGTELPIGEIGQVLVRSPGMVQRYLEDADTSRSAFGAGGFLPGDLGRLTPDGQLIYCGRSDHMMILNGINIYPAEIERAILLHPAVMDAATIPFPSALHQDVPVCAVVLQPGSSVTSTDLKAFAKQNLGAHAPRRVVVLDRIPRNEQGKLMRHDLMQALTERLRPHVATTAEPVIRSAARPATLDPGFQRFRIALSAPDKVDLASVDDWLRTILEADFDPGPYTGHREALTWRLLLLVRAVLQAGHLPAFEAGRVVRIDADNRNPGGWLAMIKIPRIDNLPERCYTLAIQAASSAMAEITSQPPSPEGLARLYASLEKDAVKPLRRLIGAGKSTVPVLRAAWQLDIPFTHLGGGIYQLGWGRNARRMDRSSTGVDPVIAAKLAQNKVWSANLLHAAGLPAPVHGLAANAEEAFQLALRLGWPVVVKPVDGDRGEGVSVGISDEASLRTAFKVAQRASRGRPVIVEREVRGVCHRLFVANGRLLYAVKRWPKSVLGDGTQTVAALIESANRLESSRPPWLRSEAYPADADTVAAMNAAGFTLESIPPVGQPIPLRRIESTAAGGLDEDVGTCIHPDNLDIALRATALFELQVAGIDIISPDIGQSWRSNGAIINEVNYAPLFGGGEISRRHIPLFFKRFIPGDGRIPVEVFVGGDTAMVAAKQRQQELCGEGVACFLTSHETTLIPDGDLRYLPFDSLHRRCRALLLDPRAALLVLVIQTDELLYASLPVDRIRQLTVVDAAVSQRNEKNLPLAQNELAKLIARLNGLVAKSTQG